MLLALHNNANLWRLPGAAVGDRKRIKIDEETYFVTPYEEAKLLQEHIKRLLQRREEIKVEVKKERKKLKAIKRESKSTRVTNVESRPIEKRVNELLKFLQSLDNKRYRKVRQLKQVKRRMDDDAISLLLLSL